MTMPHGSPVAGGNTRETIKGVADDIGALDAIGYDVERLTSVNLDQRTRMKLIGIATVAGGEEKPDGRGGTFITDDQMVLQWKVIGVEGIEDTKQYIGLPPINPDTGKRRDPAASSKYGCFLAALANLGISGNPKWGTRLLIRSMRDLIGLEVDRELQEFPGFRNRKVQVEVPVFIHGIDNEFRLSEGLEEIHLDGGTVAAPAE